MRENLETDGLILRKVKLHHGDAPVYQSANGQGISSDPAELANLVLAEQDETPRRVLELGCGTGIVSLTLAGFRPSWEIDGVDIQSRLIDIARVNALSTGATIRFVTVDFTRADFPDKQYDLMIGNPPYYPLHAGRISPFPEKAAARHELFCTLPEVVRCLDRGLTANGRAYLLYPRFRETELQSALQSHGLRASVRREIPCRRPGATTQLWRIHRESAC